MKEIPNFLGQLEIFNRELSRLNNFLEKIEPQQFRDIIEVWRDTNIVLGKLAGLNVKYENKDQE